MPKSLCLDDTRMASEVKSTCESDKPNVKARQHDATDCLRHKALWQNEGTQHRLLNAVKRSYECWHALGSHLRDEHIINNLYLFVFFPLRMRNLFRDRHGFYLINLQMR